MNLLRKTRACLTLLTLLSMASSSGVLAFGVQLFAWASMVRDFSAAGSAPAVAVKKTLNGRHPCKLCKKVSRHHLNENRTEKSPLERGSETRDPRIELAQDASPVNKEFAPGFAANRLRFAQIHDRFPGGFLPPPPSPPPRNA